MQSLHHTACGTKKSFFLDKVTFTSCLIFMQRLFFSRSIFFTTILPNDQMGRKESEDSNKACTPSNHVQDSEFDLRCPKFYLNPCTSELILYPFQCILKSRISACIIFSVRCYWVNPVSSFISIEMTHNCRLGQEI